MPSGPTGRREESVQFSLQELLKIEDERLGEQRRATAEREANAARTREEEARRKSAESEAQARKEAEDRANAARAELDELARREAMQKAVVEQARLEVEVRARTEERERERAHEIAIERLRSEAKGGSVSLGSLSFAAGLGAGIMLAVVLAVHFLVMKPAADRRVAELEGQLAGALAQRGELSRQIEEQRRAVADRERRLADALHELETARAKPPTPSAPSPGGPPMKWKPGPTAPAQAPEPDCLDGDPMCYSLKRSKK